MDDMPIYGHADEHADDGRHMPIYGHADGHADEHADAGCSECMAEAQGGRSTSV